MATQTATMTVGGVLKVTSLEEVDSSNVVLPTQDASYTIAAPVYDSTFFSMTQPSGVEWDYTALAAGSTTITYTATSSDSTKPTIDDAITVVITGPVAAGLQATLTVS